MRTALAPPPDADDNALALSRNQGKMEADVDYDHVMRVFREAAIEAGARIMEVYRADDFDVRAKSDESPVTEADEAADALISARLRAAFPDMVLVTEEQADSHAQTAATFLIVDPLDGTKEFVQRRGDFTVPTVKVLKKPALSIPRISARQRRSGSVNRIRTAYSSWPRNLTAMPRRMPILRNMAWPISKARARR
jgi:hypothetical protein